MADDWVRIGRVVGLLSVIGITVTSSGFAQNALRRGAAVQPVAFVKKGDLLLGLGAGYAADVSVPLIAVEGNMTRVGTLQISYAVADRVIVELHGDPYLSLTVDTMGAPPIEPDEGVFDGKSTGAGDFGFGFSFLPFGDADGFAAGGRLEFNIPDSNQAEGLGTNTTNIRLTVLGSYGRGPLLITGDFGIAILEAPLENFEQNDVIAYSAEFLYALSPAVPLRLYAGVVGRASTRGVVPIGTEDLGEVRLGLDYGLGRWLLDLAGLVGYAGNSPDWGVNGGVSFLIGP